MALFRAAVEAVVINTMLANQPKFDLKFGEDNVTKKKSNHDLKHELNQARNEISNLRKSLRSLQAKHEYDVNSVKELLLSTCKEAKPAPTVNPEQATSDDTDPHMQWRSIGTLNSWYKTKNATPRQGSIAPLSKATLHLNKEVFNNPEHALEGIEEFSHIWIVFVFDQNLTCPGGFRKSKVAPPRLDGKRVGLFSTRSPHRPNPIGLTLARLHLIQGNILHISGVDILDGTKVLDIKPYIPQYDIPKDVVLSHCAMSSSTEYLSESGNPCKQENCSTSSCGILSTDSISECSIIEDSNDTTDSFSIITSSSYDEDDSSLQNNRSSTPKESKKMHSVQYERGITQKKSEETFHESDEHNASSKKGNNYNSSDVRRKKIASEISRVEARIINHEDDASGTEDDDERDATVKDNDSSIEDEESCSDGLSTPEWIYKPPASPLKVIFNSIAIRQIRGFSSNCKDEKYRLKYLVDNKELECAIESLLIEDPRSTYRRKKCSDKLYYFGVDCAHVTAWFEDDTVEVLRVHPTTVQAPKDCVFLLESPVQLCKLVQDCREHILCQPCVCIDPEVGRRTN